MIVIGLPARFAEAFAAGLAKSNSAMPVTKFALDVKTRWKAVCGAGPPGGRTASCCPFSV